MTLIYEFENNGTTMVSQGNTAEGLCFGYSVVWCAKMDRYRGQNALLTRPDQHEAFPLQQRVEQIDADWRESVQKVVRGRGHTCGAQLKRNYAVVPNHIALAKENFIIDIGDHWVAASSKGGTYSFFDANEGMTTFKDADEFMGGVTTRLKRYKNDPDPDNGWEDTHNIYQVDA